MNTESFSLRDVTLRQWFFIACVLIVLCALCVAIYYFFVTQPAQIAKDEARRTLTSESAVYTDVDGETRTLEQFNGTPRLVLLWASWVPSAAAQLTIANDVASAYTDQSIAFIAINRSEPPTRAQAFLNTQTDFANLDIFIDSNDNLYESLAGYAMPETVLFDADGVIVWRQRGDVTRAQLESALELLP